MHCVYGGQFGSEGKGATVEWLASQRSNWKVVFGEGSINSGHTCKFGKLRMLPTGAFWAESVMLGPDSVISQKHLIDDIGLVSAHNDGLKTVYIHEHAAWQEENHESNTTLEARIGSTISGSGAARHHKYFVRMPE